MRFDHPLTQPVEREFAPVDFVLDEDAAAPNSYELIVDLHLVRSASVVGRVLGSSGGALSGAEVGIFSPATSADPYELRACCKTEADGRFLLHVPDSGQHELVIVLRDHGPERRTVEVPALARLDLGDIYLGTGAYLRGTVANVRFDAPWTPKVLVWPLAPEATFRSYSIFPTLYWTEDDVLLMNHDEPVSQDGSFQVLGLSRQVYGIELVQADISGVGPPGAKTMQVRAPMAGIRLADEDPVLLFDVHGQHGPIDGVLVTYSVRGRVLAARTGHTGMVLFCTPPGEQIQFAFEHPDYEPETLTVPTPAVGGYDRREVLLTPRAAGTLEVLAISQATERVLRTLDLCLEADGGSGPPRSRSSRAEDGVHRIDGILVGDYTVHVLPFGPANGLESYLASASRHVEIREGRTTRLRLVLEACGRMEILVPPVSRPLDEYQVRVLDSGSVELACDVLELPSSHRIVSPDANLASCLVVNSLPRGEYTLEVRHGETTERRSVVVRLGRTTLVDLTSR